MIQRMLTLILYPLATALLLIVITGSYSPMLAQPARPWTPDQRVPAYLDETFTPYLVADQNRTVHAFANQPVGDRNPQVAILYRQWRLDSGWSTPVDILLAPTGGDAQIIEALIDRQGMMHVMFGGGKPESVNIYYTHAPVTEAGRAPAWSIPEPVGDGASFPIGGALVGDQQGNLVMLYSGKSAGNGVYLTYSTDAGASWSKAAPLFLTYDTHLSTYSVHAYMDEKSLVHAVWSVVTDQGVDEVVYYARFDIARQLWSDPLVLEQRIEKASFFGPSFPAITGYGDTLVVMYNSGNPATDGPVEAGRPVQRVRQSNDGGQNWTEPITPFPRHLGRSGSHDLVVDSNQIVHAIFMQRIETVVDNKETVIDGPWHGALQGGQWREPDNFPATWAPHDMRAVVSQGNVLLAIWREDPGAGEHGIWYSYRVLDTPELPVLPIPTVVATPTTTTLPTVAPAPPTITPITEIVGSQRDVKPLTSRNPAQLVIFTTAPVLLLFVGLFLVRYWWRR